MSHRWNDTGTQCLTCGATDRCRGGDVQQEGCACDNKPQGAPPCPPGRCISVLTPEHLASEAHKRGTCLCGGDVQLESDFLAKSKAGEVDTKPFETKTDRPDFCRHSERPESCWACIAERVQARTGKEADIRVMTQSLTRRAQTLRDEAEVLEKQIRDISGVAQRSEPKPPRAPENYVQDDRDALNEALRRISRLEQDGMIMRERIHVLERGQREKKP